MKVGRVTLSDRAASGVYEDRSGPEIERVFLKCWGDDAVEFVSKLIPDDEPLIREVLRSLCDHEKCPLIITTGGTGPSARDVTPEATRAVIQKELPGFGEIQRMRSYEAGVRTAILSRATAGIRGQSLIVNLPGNPRAIAECLPLLVPAIREALDHLRCQPTNN